MKKLILLSMVSIVLGCSHNPPKPSGSEFPLNPIQYYQQISNSKVGE